MFSVITSKQRLKYKNSMPIRLAELHMEMNFKYINRVHCTAMYCYISSKENLRVLTTVFGARLQMYDFVQTLPLSIF